MTRPRSGPIASSSGATAASVRRSTSSRSGRIDLAPMVTHRSGLGDVATAFSVAAAKTGGAIKVVLTP